MAAKIAPAISVIFSGVCLGGHYACGAETICRLIALEMPMGGLYGRFEGLLVGCFVFSRRLATWFVGVIGRTDSRR